MTYLEAYEAIVARLKMLAYPVHETYDQQLTRPCAVIEAHPGKSDTLNAAGVLNHLDCNVTFLPELDARNNIKDQRDMMRFTDEILELFRDRKLPGVTFTVTPAGNATTESYVKLTADFAHTVRAGSEFNSIEEVNLCFTK